MVKTALVHTLLLVLTLAGIAGYYTLKPMTQRISPDVLETTARVLTIDNEEVRSSGLSHIGHQELAVEILKGPYKGKILTAFNSLVGQTDLENLFQPGDVIIVAIVLEQGEIHHVKAVDLHRQNTLLVLFCIFVAALLMYAGIIGIKALISFVLTVFILWEVLVRQILAGHNPLFTTTLTLILLSAVIIFLVAGCNKKGVTAFIGTLSGLGTALVVTFFSAAGSGFSVSPSPM